MVFYKTRFNDNNFFQKLRLENSNLLKVKKAFKEGNLKRAKFELISNMRIRDTPHFFFNPKEKEKILVTLERHFQQSKKQTIQLAEEIINHRFSLLGKNIIFNGKIDWHSTFNENKRWPLSFSPNIDYFSTKRPGDIKFAWELNKTQHFPILGKAFWLTDDEKFVKDFQSFKIFADSGYHVMRNKDKYLLFLTGPEDKKYLHASHKHLDMLSIILDAYGTYFIVDPGTYTYYGDFQWRKYFRKINAHNTAVVDCSELVNMEEIFELTSIPLCEVIEHSINDQYAYIIAKHNGYKDVKYTRICIFIKNEYWIILDFF